MINLTARRLASGLAAGVLLSLVAACGQQVSLTDEWPALPEPTVLVPTAGTCYHVNSAIYADRVVYNLMRPVPNCADEHKAETIYVGQFEGEDASRPTPPPDGGPAVRRAYQRCAEAADEFLGGEWHTARVWLRVFVPSTAAWQGGARWFRCDLFEVDGGANVVEDRTGSMRDGLRGSRPLAISCANDSGSSPDSVSSLHYVPCSEPHTAEFVGVYVPSQADLAAGGEDAVVDRIFDGCWDLADRYLGVRPGQEPEELGVFFWDFEEDRARGERAVRCFVGVLDQRTPIAGGATLKGLGSRPVPTTTR